LTGNKKHNIKPKKAIVGTIENGYKYSPELCDKILESIKSGLNVRAACKFNGIDYATFQNWRDKNVPLFERYKKALQESHEAKIELGENCVVTEMQKEGNGKLALDYLKCIAPERFSSNQNIRMEQSGKLEIRVKYGSDSGLGSAEVSPKTGADSGEPDEV
jgi:hypothetical protein